MDLEALFKISHGVYITGAKDTGGRLVGSCIDSVMVVEVSPARIMISLGKGSYTCEVVRQTGELTLSVLPETVADQTIQTFGMQSSKTVDKWEKEPYYLVSNLPVWDKAVAAMLLKVSQIIDTGSHFVFLCDVADVMRGTMENPLIYQDYQNRKRKETKMSETKKWVCTVCGYVYDGEVPFEELPEDWVCPLCGEPKSVFVQE